MERGSLSRKTVVGGKENKVKRLSDTNPRPDLLEMRKMEGVKPEESIYTSPKASAAISSSHSLHHAATLSLSNGDGSKKTYNGCIREKFESKKGSVVDKILHDLFQHGDASQKYMQGSRNIKIDNWILLDNYVPGKSIGSRTTA
ncbi:hypothetical protein SADUNF_Sadunf01G0027600 [Salix dunnii]|uniref:Uncharacterized protein n=1 Tax=Salix dunnii TaxID=1413687 RepID=A0A835TLS6_9ROSI|nr:hypothetical protein SADUNF_Sadunf01G0027600 [Salix dunnii]